MAIKNSDIRLIDGNIESVIESIREYLRHVNFKIEHEEILQKSAYIKASSLQRSFLKLYLSNSPQIVFWHIIQKNDNKIQIEVKSELFSRFRFYYYPILTFLLFCFSFFMTTSSSKSFFSFQQLSLISPAFGILIAISFLLLGYLFYLRSIITTPYEEFLNTFFKELTSKIVSSETVLQSGFGFPDFLKGPMLFAFFFILTISFSKTYNPLNNMPLPHYSFLSGAIIIALALIALAFIMAYRSSLATRVVFILIGIGICVPIAMYSNAPVALSFPGDIRQKLEHIIDMEDILSSENKTHKSLRYEKIKYSTKYVQKISLFYVSVCALLLLIIFVLFICILQVPVRIVRDLKRFSYTQPDSSYYQALHSNKMSYLFNFIVIFLWAIISAINILGLFFSFSIFERAILSMNFIFKSELAKLFYDNTQVTFIILMQSKLGNHIFLIHRMFMLLYSIPMIILFFLVIGKNIKSFIEEYSLLKNHPGKHKRIENYLKEVVKDICKTANISIPVIRVTNSSDLNPRTIYLGFPFYKNILIVPKGVWLELHNIEEELNALLAHEIWHIKKHTLTRKFLCFLSDYSFFGNGFLALLQNSYQVEKEADDFAIRWLLEKHQNKYNVVHSLRSLLERIDEIIWRNTLLQSSNSYNFAKLKDPLYRDEILTKYDSAQKIERLKINLRILYQMYFGNVILSYFHPSNEQRISWAEEKYGTSETN